MTEKIKKPLYKKWWFWLIIVVVAIGVIGSGEDDNETAEQPQQEDATTETTEKEPETKEVVSVVEHEDELLFGEYTVNNIKTEIENDELKLMFEWINQSGKDDIPFTSVGYFDVMQGEEILKETSGAFDPGANSDILRRTDHGIISPVTLTYEIKNDKPIEIQFGATHELDDKTESIIVE